MNHSYSPIFLVRECHKIPHLNDRLQFGSYDFTVSTDNIWNSYTTSLFTIPIILFSIVSFIIIMIYCIVLFASSRCRRINTVNAFNTVETSSNLLNLTINRGSSHKISNDLINNSSHLGLPINSSTVSHRSNCTPSINKLYIAIGVFTIFSITANNSVFSGNKYFSRGINCIHASFGVISTTVQSLFSDGQSLTKDGYTLTLLIDNSLQTCSQASNLIIPVNDLNNDFYQYNMFIEPLPSKLSNIIDSTHQVGVVYKSYSLWTVYAINFFICILCIVSIVRQSKSLVEISICGNGLLLVICFALGSFVMAILVGLADFCMSPYDNMLSSISSDSTSELVSYYSSCEGANPLYTSVSSAQSSVGGMYSYIDDLLSSSCMNNSYLVQAQNNITAIQSSLSSIELAYACSPIEYEFNQILTNGLCEEGFTGLYIIWIWIYISSSIAVLSTIIVSVIYMYFGRYWNIDEDDHHSSIFDEEYASYTDSDKANTMVVNPATVIVTSSSRHSSLRRNSQTLSHYDGVSSDHI